MKKILEGSRAIAEIIKLIKPQVVSAYPITPQTHIVEDLAKFKADGLADYEYVRAESEFAAASIVLGGSATGVRVYSATSSQGLLLMTEVLFNIAGMRLPVVFTIANRGVSAPITIWNDHQDVMTIRDSGWLIFFAENAQEAIEEHLIAYKVAEKMGLPAMVNVDGFVLTHTYEPVDMPTQAQVKKFLPPYKPEPGTYLDTDAPVTLGAFATPQYYLAIRQDLQDLLVSAAAEVKKAQKQWRKIFPLPKEKKPKGLVIKDKGLVEYYGAPQPKTVFVVLGSVAGTVKDFINREAPDCGVIKLRLFRPFPQKELVSLLADVPYVAVLDKNISLGQEGILATEIKSLFASTNKRPKKIMSFVAGLGGRDIAAAQLRKALAQVKKEAKEPVFLA